MSAHSGITRFEYPLRIRRAAAALWGLVLLLNLFEFLLAWLRAFYGWLAAPLQLPAFAILTPPQDILTMLLTAHIGLAFALIAANALAFLVPRIIVRANGLAVQTEFGTRVVPFDKVDGVHSVEMPGGRFVVWVDSASGMPVQNWIASLLFGRWLRSGLFLTSDLAGFDNIVATLVAQLKRKYGGVNLAAHLSEEKPTWLLSMLVNPLATIRQVSAESVIPFSTREATWQMVSVAASFAIPQLVAAIIHVQIPWGALVVFLFALLEWPLASLYLTDVPVEYLRRLEFQDVLRLYPLSQLPRWYISTALTLLVIAGAPLWMMILTAIPAIALGCFLVLKLTEDWFAVRNPDALLGLLVTVIVQFMLYALFVAILAR